MIRRPTVFVVGAGGSVPYAFPSGPKMLRDARSQSAENLYHLTLKRFPLPLMRTFHEALSDTASSSIDSLLEHRADLDAVGRRYIARSILAAEWDNPENRPLSGDWLGYLFEQIDTGGSAEAFFKSPVTFVTYNYDRLIEYWISRGLRARYRVTETELADLWRKYPKVIHLHGSVGSFGSGPNHVAFGGRVPGRTGNFEEHLTTTIEVAEQLVKVVHQADGKSPEFERARNALRDAEAIFFLGFSFGSSNVDRLGFENIRVNADVICGRYGMTDSEVNVFIREPLKRNLNSAHTVGQQDWDCEKILREFLQTFVTRY